MSLHQCIQPAGRKTRALSRGRTLVRCMLSQGRSLPTSHQATRQGENPYVLDPYEIGSAKTRHLLNFVEAQPDLSHGYPIWFGSHVALRFLMASGAIPAFLEHGDKSVKTPGVGRARAEGSNSGVLSYSRHVTSM